MGEVTKYDTVKHDDEVGHKKRRSPTRDVMTRLNVLTERQRKEILGVKNTNEEAKNIAKEITAIRTSRKKNCCKAGCRCGTDECPCVQMGVNCHKEGEESDVGCQCALDACFNPYGRYYFDPAKSAQLRAVKIISLQQRELPFETDRETLKRSVRGELKDEDFRPPSSVKSDTIEEILSPRSKGLGKGVTEEEHGLVSEDLHCDSTEEDSPIEANPLPDDSKKAAVKAAATAAYREAIRAKENAEKMKVEESRAEEFKKAAGKTAETSEANAAYRETRAAREGRAAKQFGQRGKAETGLKNKPGTAKVKAGETTSIDDWLSPPPKWHKDRDRVPSAATGQETTTQLEERPAGGDKSAPPKANKVESRVAEASEPALDAQKKSKEEMASNKKKIAKKKETYSDAADFLLGSDAEVSSSDLSSQASASLSLSPQRSPQRGLGENTAVPPVNEDNGKDNGMGNDSLQDNGKAENDEPKSSPEEQKRREDKKTQEYQKWYASVQDARKTNMEARKSQSPAPSPAPSPEPSLEKKGEPVAEGASSSAAAGPINPSVRQDLQMLNMKQLREYAIEHGANRREIMMAIDKTEVIKLVTDALALNQPESLRSRSSSVAVLLDQKLADDLTRIEEHVARGNTPELLPASQKSPPAIALDEPSNELVESASGVQSEWRAKLVDFYERKGKSEMLPQVDRLLFKYQGREDQLMAGMIKKYGPVPGE